MFLTPQQFRFAMPHDNSASTKRGGNLSCRRAFQDRCVNTVNSQRVSHLETKQLLKSKVNLFQDKKQSTTKPKEDDTPAWMYEMTTPKEYQYDFISVKPLLPPPLTPPPSPCDDINELYKDLPTPNVLNFDNCFDDTFYALEDVDKFSTFTF